MPKTHATVVLVHGAWHGSWCWQWLTPRLLAHALAVRTPDLPSATSTVAAGLTEDARHLNAVLSAIDGPVILCGHSYGGMVISAADTTRADVRHLVYLCAYLTAAGESVESSLRAAGERRSGHWIRRLPDGRTSVDAARAATHFYADCPAATREWALARLKPHWGQGLAETVQAPAWQRHACTYVVCEQDQALAPRIQRTIYGARAQRLVALPCGHSPFLAQPGSLAQLLADIAQASIQLS